MDTVPKPEAAFFAEPWRTESAVFLELRKRF